MCILLANQVLRIHAASVKGLIDAIMPALMTRSVFYYLGWYVTLRLLFESSAETLSTKVDVTFVILIASLNFLSGNSIVWLSITITGIFLLVMSQGADKLKAAAVVLLALSFNGLWGPLFFDIFAFQLLRADAAIVGVALSATQPNMAWGETIVGMPDGHSVQIYGPCSSFHNISLGLLCWVSVTKLVRTDWIRSDFLVALFVCAAVILLNGARLYLMALSPDHFAYWHDGFGQQLFAWGTTFTVLLMSLRGAFLCPGRVR